VVFRTPLSVAFNYIYDNTTCIISSANAQLTFVIDADKTARMWNGVNLRSTTPLFVPNKIYVLSVFHNQANSFFRYNKNETAKGNPGTNIMQTISRIGASCMGLSASNQMLTGNIGEFIVFDRALRETEYLAIEDYLNRKWSAY